MKEYISADRIRELCEKLEMPAKIISTVLCYIKSEEALIAKQYFEGLFNPETAGNAAKEIGKLFAGENDKLKDDGFGALAVFLAAALKTKEMYESLGIDDLVFYDTMSWFVTDLKDNASLYGKAYFSGGILWYYRHICMSLFKLGSLEYEFMTLDNEYAQICSLKEGESVLSVHIPTDADLSRLELDKSYQKALSFFERYYPSYEYNVFFCSSWLLSPALIDLLPSHSRILEFQKDYKVVHVDNENTEFMARVYATKDKNPDYRSLPENTTLQRVIKKRLLQGGKIGWATGFFDKTAILDK